VELLLALGRAVEADLRDDGRVSWTIGNCPIDYHNAVVWADLAPGEAGTRRSRGFAVAHAGTRGPWVVACRALDAPL